MLIIIGHARCGAAAASVAAAAAAEAAARSFESAFSNVVKC